MGKQLWRNFRCYFYFLFLFFVNNLIGFNLDDDDQLFKGLCISVQSVIPKNENF